MQEYDRTMPTLKVDDQASTLGRACAAMPTCSRPAIVTTMYCDNRIHTLDLRLLSGSTSVHSDMLMRNPAELAESAALQFLGVLFAVSQISVRLDQLTHRHLAMLRSWLGLWRDHRDMLLDGELRPQHLTEDDKPGCQLLSREI